MGGSRCQGTQKCTKGTLECGKFILFEETKHLIGDKKSIERCYSMSIYTFLSKNRDYYQECKTRECSNIIRLDDKVKHCELCNNQVAFGDQPSLDRYIKPVIGDNESDVHSRSNIGSDDEDELGEEDQEARDKRNLSKQRQDKENAELLVDLVDTVSLIAIERQQDVKIR